MGKFVWDMSKHADFLAVEPGQLAMSTLMLAGGITVMADDINVLGDFLTL
ncbi:hypothetical protein KBZ18_03355 [Synechococcus sp. Cruz-9H2]|nr:MULTISPECIES: hypothetical protein [unclassified Synechococcus]MCP9818529.1 hypothetical protein [Synechococcus sp. Cruz-9H2]MCP9842760.1 hypothetical protein [Synechococcus sp. Edmonson 11F2]MCP9855425.1 hypothetical protein [Synechococcus sp. Cruz-9C9]MCP9862328.1 hypothetical protein [Synechococcus sp. Cruz-7E5]MCP9869600.1 hypothetical protein [Synechococcus sp. Cruz-7B9]